MNQPNEAAGTSSDAAVSQGPRKLLRLRYGIPVLVYFLLRIDDAGFWLWGVINKAPWNGWGCSSTSWFTPGFCVPVTLQAEAAHLPFGTGSVLLQQVLPHLGPFEWFQFLLETILAATLFVGVVTRFFALVATFWAAFTMSMYVWVPGEVFPDSMLFILVPLTLVTIGGGNFLTLDAYLKPRLNRRRGRWARLVTRWMY
ncbi:MAG: hypothetical protein L3K14_06325 [Thermoplasmata archaeon]|nr:hypothetical protein [Thermoplasmata archaeon]